MKNILALAAIAAPLVSPAQNWSYNLLYDFGSKETSAVVATPVITLKDLFGVKGLNADIDAFGGIGLKTGTPVAGFALLSKSKAADRLDVYFGPAVTVQGGQPASFGLLAGLTIKF